MGRAASGVGSAGCRPETGAGDRYAAAKLADLLYEYDDLDGAEHVLRGLAEAGGTFAARDLDRLRARQTRSVLSWRWSSGI